MKRKSQPYTRTLSQIIAGFMLTAESRHLSPHTIADYSNTFRKFQAYLEKDLPFHTITCYDIESFLAAQTISKKTILN